MTHYTKEHNKIACFFIAYLSRSYSGKKNWTCFLLFQAFHFLYGRAEYGTWNLCHSYRCLPKWPQTVVPGSAFLDMLWDSTLFCCAPLCRRYTFVFLRSNIITLNTSIIDCEQNNSLELVKKYNKGRRKSKPGRNPILCMRGLASLAQLNLLTTIYSGRWLELVVKRLC